MKRDSINHDLVDKLVNTSANDENSKDSKGRTQKQFDINSIVSDHGNEDGDTRHDRRKSTRRDYNYTAVDFVNGNGQKSVYNSINFANITSALESPFGRQYKIAGPTHRNFP